MCDPRRSTYRRPVASIFCRRVAVAAAAVVGLQGGITAAPAEPRAPVKSLLELRDSGVVRQHYDLSCGAAALATLLKYQHAEVITEKEVALGLVGRSEYLESPEIVRLRQGFSLLDLKRYTERRGYRGLGFGKMTLPDLLAKGPAIVALNLLGYPHFVVFRGMLGNRVLVADPAFGNRTMTVDRFERAWIDYPGFGRTAFLVGRRDGRRPPSDRLVPRPTDFPILR